MVRATEARRGSPPTAASPPRRAPSRHRASKRHCHRHHSGTCAAAPPPSTGGGRPRTRRRWRWYEEEGGKAAAPANGGRLDTSRRGLPNTQPSPPPNPPPSPPQPHDTPDAARPTRHARPSQPEATAGRPRRPPCRRGVTAAVEPPPGACPALNLCRHRCRRRQRHHTKGSTENMRQRPARVSYQLPPTPRSAASQAAPPPRARCASAPSGHPVPCPPPQSLATQWYQRRWWPRHLTLP